MDPLFTVNKRGYLFAGEPDPLKTYIHSESGKAKFYLNRLDAAELSRALITKKPKFTSVDGIIVDLEFKNPGEVTLIWIALSAFERATFNEADLALALIEVLCSPSLPAN